MELVDRLIGKEYASGLLFCQLGRDADIQGPYSQHFIFFITYKQGDQIGRFFTN